MIHSMQLAVKRIEEQRAIEQYVNEEGPRLRAQVNALEQQLAAKDQTISSLQNQLLHQKNAVSSYASQLSRKDTAITDKRNELNQVQAELLQVKAEHARQLTAKETELQNQRAQVADLSSTVQELNKIIEAIQVEHQEGSAAVEGIPVSLSVDANSQTDSSTMLAGEEEDYTMVEH